MIRLLYIDDNSGMLEIVKFCIEADPNFQVDTVHSSREGLEVLETRAHDGVLVDLHMSGLDGLAVLEEVRARYGDLPVALLGTAPESAMVIRALNAGADLFLNKGVGLVTELDEAVQRMVGLVEQRRARRDQEERRRELERWADNIAEMVLCTDLQFRITSVNQVTCRHLGCDKAELVGKPLAHLVNAQDRTRTMLETGELLWTGSAPARCGSGWTWRTKDALGWRPGCPIWWTTPDRPGWCSPCARWGSRSGWRSSARTGGGAWRWS